MNYFNNDSESYQLPAQEPISQPTNPNGIENYPETSSAGGKLNNPSEGVQAGLDNIINGVYSTAPENIIDTIYNRHY